MMNGKQLSSVRNFQRLFSSPHHLLLYNFTTFHYSAVSVSCSIDRSLVLRFCYTRQFHRLVPRYSYYYFPGRLLRPIRAMQNYYFLQQTKYNQLSNPCSCLYCLYKIQMNDEDGGTGMEWNGDLVAEA